MRCRILRIYSSFSKGFQIWVHCILVFLNNGINAKVNSVISFLKFSLYLKLYTENLMFQWSTCLDNKYNNWHRNEENLLRVFNENSVSEVPGGGIGWGNSNFHLQAGVTNPGDTVVWKAVTGTTRPNFSFLALLWF